MARRVWGRRFRHAPRIWLPHGMAVICLALAACGGSSTARLTAPTDLLAHGNLTVGSDTTYPPQEYVDPATHKVAGFDIDLITAMANRLGVQVRVVPDTFDPLLSDLAAKHFDVVISAVTITPERQKTVDFIPYLKVGESLLVRTGNPKNIHSTDDLCGLAVGVQQGTIEEGVLHSTSDNCVEQDKPAISVLALADQTAVIQLLATSKVVATYQDSPVTDYYAQQNPSQFVAGGATVFASPEGIAVRKNDAAMLTAMRTAFDQVKAMGIYAQLARKWGLTGEALKDG